MPDEYLWDRSGELDPEIDQLEKQLGKYRCEQHQFYAPKSVWHWYAVAAGVVIALMAGWQYWPTTPSDWIMNGQTLAVNRVIGIDKPTEVEVGSIGRLNFKPGSRFRILKSAVDEEVMELLEGSFDALIIANPYVFRVVTEPARLDDLGCAYEVSLNDQGNGKVAVSSGWVRVNGRDQESLVKQGYEVDLIKGQAPSIPRRTEVSSETDVLQLLHQLWREKQPELRARAFDKLAALHPPPAGVTRERAIRGDLKIVKDYWPALDLGPEIALPRIFLGE